MAKPSPHFSPAARFSTDLAAQDLRRSDGGTPSVPGEFRSEVDVVASLAERILPEGRIDPVSKTPAFKSVVARLRAV